MIKSAVTPEWRHPAQVHQAEGVLSARLGVTIPEAVVVLRTISHCVGAPLIDVARKVLEGPSSE
ncbi:ANTAR domain-containing protein [Actinomycetospora sp.]|uniref:ANTAR domain-containing protein n=1 Tax=Actinomycetospora sp. TaxID=1872135 RepID=UPI002F41E267